MWRDLLAERGIIVSCEAIRFWCLKFGSEYAQGMGLTSHRASTLLYRSLVAYFGLVAWLVAEMKSDRPRLEEAAEGRTPGIVREQSAGGTQSHE